jgi:transposase
LIHFPSFKLIREMAMSVSIVVRGDFNAAGLRVLAGKTRDASQARRLLSIAAVCEGMDRDMAARIGGMDRQTLRDWVRRFNEFGPDGLVSRKPSGRPSKLSSEQKEELRALVESGPDPQTDGVVRWRCVDLKRVLGERFAVDLSEVSLGRILKKLGYSHISARPRHPAQDGEAIAAFKKTFPPSPLTQ